MCSTICDVHDSATCVIIVTAKACRNRAHSRICHARSRNHTYSEGLDDGQSWPRMGRSHSAMECCWPQHGSVDSRRQSCAMLVSEARPAAIEIQYGIERPSRP